MICGDNQRESSCSQEETAACQVDLSAEGERRDKAAVKQPSDRVTVLSIGAGGDSSDALLSAGPAPEFCLIAQASAAMRC